MSWDLVKACTVAIETPNSEIRGTGFFISSQGHLLTCAHVVEEVGGWDNVRVNGQKVDLVYLGDRTCDDFAILQLSGYQGDSVPLAADFQPMDRFLSIGYGRLDFPQGASIDGTITDVNPQFEFSSLPMLRLRVKANSQQVQGGYSGSPVFNAETQRVIGIIAAYDNTEGALALPLATIKQKWSNLSIFKVKQTSEQDCDIDALVEEIREHVKPSIEKKCGTMRVLDMPQPIELTGERGIYTNVNILEKITGRRRLDIPELLQNSNPDDFERFGLNRVKEKRVPGIEAVQQHQKLMVLGKPGAGKTTFLKYLAMQCIEGQYLTNKVPVFITLKEFAEESQQPNILEYVAQKLSVCGVKDASIKAEQLLRQGKLLVLLDGLDEVREEDTKRVSRQIRNISDQFHTNQFVITCRIAAKEYTFEQFKEYTDVEVADFGKEQIAIFAENWFRLSEPNEAKRFIHKLEDNKRIQELATNPLLLTLLCLVFAEKRDLPKRRSKLYQYCLKILLKKWDAKIFNERDHVYKNFSVQDKESLLSQIGVTTFEQQNYFFEQETIEAYITEFFHKLYHTYLDPEILRLDSEAILKSLEAQHGLLVERANGIYSFSHLTFHEYFAAKYIVANSADETLVSHLADKRWHEVFLLSVGMMPKADTLLRLMKSRIDGLLSLDENLQNFLKWVNNKSLLAESSYKPAAVRAFYFALEHKLIRDWDSQNIDKYRINFLEYETFKLAYSIDEAIYYALTIDLDIDYAQDLEYDIQIIESNICIQEYEDEPYCKSTDNIKIKAHNISEEILFTSEDNEIFLEEILFPNEGNDIILLEQMKVELSEVIEQINDPSRKLHQEMQYDLDIAQLITSSFCDKRLYIEGDFIRTVIAENLSTNLKHELKILFQQIRQQIYSKKNLTLDNFKQLKNIMLIQHRNIGHEWQFNNTQKELLKEYYYANQLLVDCLNSDCYISRNIRQEIEDTLLLPMSELKNRN
ncbi:NACHT domain family protein [Nostoc carneum NIES-2107]|nr:NACHT domain family protein [Nostoc carneum NIES-2107]